MTQDTTLFTMLTAAVLTGVIHTLAGPDHYLPFIAISRLRSYGWGKTLVWTILCGLGHIGSSFLLAAFFLLFADILSRMHWEWFDAVRGNLAAWTMTGTGAAMLLYSLHCRWKHRARSHRHIHADGSVTIHSHELGELHGHEKLSYWIVFIIFVLGPCEALLPLLTASAVLGRVSVLLVALFFSVVTIGTMCAAVAAGRLGLTLLRFGWLERFAPEFAGATVMFCGMAIIVFGL